MNKTISCCGVVCSECESYYSNCDGCSEEKGIVYWLKYTGEPICPIYQCCINEKHYSHCGKCSLLPCNLYFNGDPTKTEEENENIRKNQMRLLLKMKSIL